MFLSSQSVDCWLLQTLIVCVSVCLCVGRFVCPALQLLSRLLWISFWLNLVKMLELWSEWMNFILLKFHKNRFSVDAIMTSFLFCKMYFKGNNSFQRETTLCKGKQLCYARLLHKRQRSCNVSLIYSSQPVPRCDWFMSDLGLMLRLWFKRH